MDFVVWLRSLGLGKYEAAFREHDIDETVLPNLTAGTSRNLASPRWNTAATFWMPALRHDTSAPGPSSDVKTAPTALATRSGQDAAVHALSYRSLALWSLCYPEAAEV